MADETKNPERGALVRQELGAELQVTATLNAETLAKRQEALIRSKVYMARQFPRVIEDIERKLVHECKRPLMAERARYALPRSTYEDGKRITKTITGWSIRFAEQAMRLFGNVEVNQLIVSEDRNLRVIEVGIIDYETMVSESRQIALNKTVERKKVFENHEVLEERRNATTGEVIYIVAASEADMLAKTNGQISRAKRNLILELIPPDTLAACERQVNTTIADTDKKDPDAAKKRLIDSFAQLGVTAGQLTAYVGKPLGDVGELDLKVLRGVYEAVRTGEATWKEVMDEKNPVKADDTTAPPPPAGEKKPEAKPSPPKTAAAPTLKGKPGTVEFTESLQALIRAAPTTEQLKALAVHIKDVARDYKGGTEAIYAVTLDALQKAGK